MLEIMVGHCKCFPTLPNFILAGSQRPRYYNLHLPKKLLKHRAIKELVQGHITSKILVTEAPPVLLQSSYTNHDYQLPRGKRGQAPVSL